MLKTYLRQTYRFSKEIKQHKQRLLLLEHSFPQQQDRPGVRGSVLQGTSRTEVTQPGASPDNLQQEDHRVVPSHCYSPVYKI